MSDLVSFLIELGCDDAKWHAYDSAPGTYIDNSSLSDEDKTLMKSQNAEAINSAIVARGGGSRVEMFAAGQVRAGVTLRRVPAPPPAE
jgi:hypothetical protein